MVNMYELIVYITTYHNYCVYCVYIVRVAIRPIGFAPNTASLTRCRLAFRPVTSGGSTGTVHHRFLVTLAPGEGNLHKMAAAETSGKYGKFIFWCK